MLFSNPTIAKLMNEEFVPHWVNVRDVPKVTIDFGKGRVLERTLNGNIATYVCFPDGRTIDVVTGLNDEATYQRRLQEGLEVYRALRAQERGSMAGALLRYHEVALSADHGAALRALKGEGRIQFTRGSTRVAYKGDLKGVARYEETHAMTKAVVEGPLKRAIAIDPGLPQSRLPAPSGGLSLRLPAPRLGAATARHKGLKPGREGGSEGAAGGAAAKRLVEQALKRTTGPELGEEPSFAEERDPLAKGMVEQPLKRALSDSEALARLRVTEAVEVHELKPYEGPSTSKMHVEGPLKTSLRPSARTHLSPEEAALVEKARPTLDADSLHNESVRRLQVHRLLLLRPLQQPSALAAVVYKEIMHVDISDPFLGLAPMVVGGEIGRHGVSEK